MNHNWYLNTSEFVALCVAVLEEMDYFKKDQLAHPEDISNAIVMVAPAIAIGVAFGGRTADANNAINIARGQVD